MTKLTKEQGDLVALALLQNQEMKFDRLRTLLKFPAEAKFNIQSERRVTLDGDETAGAALPQGLYLEKPGAGSISIARSLLLRNC